ncbi:hypothetical protein, partial [Bifidobacterium thermophilum]|uniref:hypothetical protein n=1 Tax=Bifidobacterium thermophilum TaxID=33905 RepID=UPI001E5EA4DE
MRISQPLQPMAPLIVLALGSLSIVSLAQGIVSWAIGTKRGVLDFHFWLVDVSFADVESRFVRRI